MGWFNHQLDITLVPCRETHHGHHGPSHDRPTWNYYYPIIRGIIIKALDGSLQNKNNLISIFVPPSIVSCEDVSYFQVFVTWGAKMTEQTATNKNIVEKRDVI